MFLYYAAKFIGLLLFFLFGSAHLSAAGKASSEGDWSSFGVDLMMAIVFIGGMLWILGLI